MRITTFEIFESSRQTIAISLVNMCIVIGHAQVTKCTLFPVVPKTTLGGQAIFVWKLDFLAYSSARLLHCDRLPYSFSLPKHVSRRRVCGRFPSKRTSVLLVPQSISIQYE